MISFTARALELSRDRGQSEGGQRAKPRAATMRALDVGGARSFQRSGSESYSDVIIAAGEGVSLGLMVAFVIQFFGC